MGIIPGEEVQAQGGGAERGRERGGRGSESKRQRRRSAGEVAVEAAVGRGGRGLRHLH